MAENFLATITRHDDEHNTLPRIGTARPRSRRDLGGKRGADPGRECVGRAWSRWPWNALTFTVSAVPDEDREKERGETSTRTHAPLATESATHSATSRRESSFVYVDDGLSRNLALPETTLGKKCGPLGKLVATIIRLDDSKNRC